MSNQFDMKAFNAALIEEFRANGGKVGGRFEGRPVLLLTTTGAKSGGGSRCRWCTCKTASDG